MIKSDCVENLTSEEVEQRVYNEFNRVFVTVVVPIIIVLGLITNGVFLFVLYRIREMRTITNFYLAHLAVADGCLLLDSSFQWIISYNNSPLDQGFSFRTSLGCALPNFLLYVFYYSSVFLVTLVILERYVAICHPMLYRSSLGDSYRRLSIVGASIIWILSFLMACSTLTHSKPRKLCVQWPEKFVNYPEQLWDCTHDLSWCNWCPTVMLMTDLCQFCFCISVVTFMSISICVCLIRGEIKSRRTSIRSIDTMKARLCLSRMVMINAFIFFVCLTPYEIINLNNAFKTFGDYFIFNFSDDARKYILWIGRVTMIINSAINPIIYSAVNPRYREAVCEACCFCCFQQLRQWRSDDRPQQRTYSFLEQEIKTNGQEPKHNDMGLNEQIDVNEGPSKDNYIMANENGQGHVVYDEDALWIVIHFWLRLLIGHKHDQVTGSDFCTTSTPRDH